MGNFGRHFILWFGGEVGMVVVGMLVVGENLVGGREDGDSESTSNSCIWRILWLIGV